MNKVCIFCGFYPLIKGGAEYQAKIISEQILLMEGKEVFYISFGHDCDEVIYVGGVKVYCFKNPTMFDSFTLYKRIGLKIKKIIKNEKPDIIYQRILNSYSPHLVALANILRIKILIHVADNYSLSFSYNLRSFIRRLFFNRIRKFFNKGTSVGFIAQTKYQEARLKHLGIPALAQIYNMHPLPTKNEASDFLLNGLEFLVNGNLNVFWIANERPVKRLDLALKLAAELSQCRVNFIFIGKTNNQFLIETERDRTNGNIFYLGQRDNDFINPILNYAHFLLNTSDSEGFSNTFIQAWLRGVPVLSLNSDPDDLIKNYNLGLCSGGELSDLAAIIDSSSRNIEGYMDSFPDIDITCRELFGLERNFSLLLDTIGKLK